MPQQFGIAYELREPGIAKLLGPEYKDRDDSWFHLQLRTRLNELGYRHDAKCLYSKEAENEEVVVDDIFDLRKRFPWLKIAMGNMHIVELHDTILYLG
jgi:virulence-associated protein VapD